MIYFIAAALTLYSILFLFQDFYCFISLKDWIKVLFESSSANFSEYQTLFFSILIGLVGVYFTVISIILNKKDISPFSCIKYTFFWDDYFLAFELGICLVLSLICFPYIRFTKAVQNYIIASIFVSVLLFIKSTYALVYTDRKSNAIKHFKKQIEYFIRRYKRDINKRNKKINDFVFDFVFKSFPNEKFIILKEAYEQLQREKTCTLELDGCYCALIDSLSAEKLTADEPNGLKSYISFISERLFLIIYKNSKSDFDNNYKIVSAYCKKIIELYKAYLYKDLLHESYFLLLSEPFTLIFKLDLSHYSKDKLLQIFYYLMKECKQLIYISLYHCGFETVRDEIHNYMNFVQFINIKDKYKNLVKEHDKCLIDIAVRIINVIQIGRISSKYLLFIKPLLSQCNKITIFDVDDEMYDEILPPIGMYEVKYTRNFYISIILFWLAIENEDYKKLLLNKLNYSGINTNDIVWAFKDIDNSLDKILIDDLNKILINITDDMFEKTKKKIKALLFFKEKQLNNIKVQNLAVKNCDNKLSEEIKKRKTEFENEFEFLKSKAKKYIVTSIEGLEFVFSKAELCGEIGVKFMGFSFYSYLKEFLFNMYIGSAEIKTIYSLTEIDKVEADNELLLSQSYRQDFYEDKRLNYFGGDLYINEKRFELDYIFTDTNLIVNKKDFVSCIAFESIDILLDKRHDEKKDAIRDVFIHVPFIAKFKTAKKKHFAYKLLKS